MAGDNQSSPAPTTAVRPLPILGTAFLLGLLFNYFLFGKVPGLGYTLFVVAIVSGAVVVSWQAKKPLSRGAVWYAALAVIFSAGVSWRSSYELTFMNVVLSMFLLLLVVSEAIGNRIRTLPIEKYFSLAWLLLYFLGNIGLLFGAWSQERQGERTGKSSAIVRGVLLALPVLVLFTLLFSSADLIWQKYVKDIIHINISLETLVRSFLVILVTLGLSGAGWYMFTNVRKIEQRPDDVKRTGLGSTEVRILLGSVNVLFLLFIIVQLAYLFGGQNNIAGQGFTYAEYARRGFFELIIVAVISWLVVWTLDRTLAKSNTNAPATAKFMSLTLIVQVFVIMASAFMRLVLYEQAYGFTTLRFYSHAFIVWLALVFVLLLYKLFVSRREDRLAFSILISVLTFAGAVNLFNPDAFIARQNMERYSATGKVDVFYLDRLSPDAVQAALPILETKDIEAAKIAANRFFWKLDRLNASAARWQSYNLGRRQARKLLQPKRQELEKSKDFIPSLDWLQSQSMSPD